MLFRNASLELGDAGKDGQHHPSGWAVGIDPGSPSERSPAPASRQLLRDLEQVTGGAGQAVEAVDHDHVVLAHLIEQARQLRPITPGTRELSS